MPQEAFPHEPSGLRDPDRTDVGRFHDEFYSGSASLVKKPPCESAQCITSKSSPTRGWSGPITYLRYPVDHMVCANAAGELAGGGLYHGKEHAAVLPSLRCHGGDVPDSVRE